MTTISWLQFTRLFANKKAIIILQVVFIFLFLLLQFRLPDINSPAKLQSETELERIKNSVKIELRELERTRDIEQKKVESVRKNVFAEEQHLKQLKSDVANYRGQIQALERELRQKAAIQNPPVMPPERIFPPLDIPTIPYRANIDCSRGDCFDYTRCPLTGGFPVYLYPINHIRDDVKRRRAVNIQNGLRQMLQIVEDANIACIWFFISERVDVLDTALIEHWHGDGRNHVILDLSGDSSWADIGRASKMGTGLAQVFPFDLLLPEPIELHKPIWEISPLMTPIHRAHRLVFQFSAPPAGSAIVDQLALLKKQPDNVIEPLSCGAKPWANCGTLEERLELLSTSTFSLVLVENNFADVSERLLESLLSGAVPVVLSYSGLLPLPLDGVIDWSRASLQLPLSRLPELSFLLSSMTSGDIFDMRRQGRFLLEEYFSSEVKSVYSGLQMLRHKIGLIPNPYEQTQGATTNIEKFYPPTLPAEPNFLDEEAKDEFVSIQSLSPLPSPVFPQNYTYLIKDYFNSVGPFAHKMIDVNILTTPLPSEEKFYDKRLPFDPICGGAGGDGTQYQNALGGNFPREEFTVVILTYKRDDVLIGTLSRLVNQPHLNKVLVVWNSPYAVPDSLQWPAIGAPIEVVVPEKNSLNNRFLPFENIETEAVLSLDDDTHLRRDEIEFAFRTWRENRDRIVGFPGRHHSWENGGWFYNSNHTCELSMVLTGAAFFHKQYSYLYSNWQPPEVKALVDEFMNCEDIALNFLVSHLTRKPPVKVTSRWTFRCLGCPEALSSTDGHFNERHYCIKRLTKIWGYNPLLYTGYRVDSVLFKTRLPHDKQKCFKFI